MSKHCLLQKEGLHDMVEKIMLRLCFMISEDDHFCIIIFIFTEKAF